MPSGISFAAPRREAVVAGLSLNASMSTGPRSSASCGARLEAAVAAAPRAGVRRRRCGAGSSPRACRYVQAPVGRRSPAAGAGRRTPPLPILPAAAAAAPDGRRRPRAAGAVPAPRTLPVAAGRVVNGAHADDRRDEHQHGDRAADESLLHRPGPVAREPARESAERARDRRRPSDGACRRTREAAVGVAWSRGDRTAGADCGRCDRSRRGRARSGDGCGADDGAVGSRSGAGRRVATRSAGVSRCAPGSWELRRGERAGRVTGGWRRERLPGWQSVDRRRGRGSGRGGVVGRRPSRGSARRATRSESDAAATMIAASNGRLATQRCGATPRRRGVQNARFESSSRRLSKRRTTTAASRNTVSVEGMRTVGAGWGTLGLVSGPSEGRGIELGLKRGGGPT